MRPERTAVTPGDAWSRLSAVEQTLLVPLMARAWAARWHLDSDTDEGASRALACLGCPEPDWPDWVTWHLILWRSRWLRQWAREFFVHNPQAFGINLGAGLSDYFQWLKGSARSWVDVDHHEVMQLRRRCLRPCGDALELDLDIRSPDLWRRVPTPDLASSSMPRWIMLEGVLMYWTPNQVRQFLVRLAQHVPSGSWLAFDVIPSWLIGWPVQVPSLSGKSVTFRWGIHDVSELGSMHPRLQLARVISTPSPWSLAAWTLTDSHPGWDPMAVYALVLMRVH